MVSQRSTMRDAVAGERHRHVQHAQAPVGVVVDEHRRQHGADGRLADERLASADAVAAVDLHGGAAGVGVVAAAGGDDDDAVLGDATQRGLRAGQVAAVAPRGERGDVLVHRRGEGGRAAVLGQLALDGGDLADGGAVAAELGRDGDGQQAGVADVLERLVHPGAVAVVLGGVWSEDRPAGGGPLDERALVGRAGGVRRGGGDLGDCHVRHSAGRARPLTSGSTTQFVATGLRSRVGGDVGAT